MPFDSISIRKASRSGFMGAIFPDIQPRTAASGCMTSRCRKHTMDILANRSLRSPSAAAAEPAALETEPGALETEPGALEPGPLIVGRSTLASVSWIDGR